MKQGFIIPVYNHGNTLEIVVSALQKYDLPIIIVDDGNDEENKSFINLVVQKYSNVVLITNRWNRGKGAAVCKGIKKAHKMGITHLFQIDADGQHDTLQCDMFLEESKNNPEALICGYPKFDESVPEARLKGRQISNNYAEFVTLWKGGIKDAMCGYRIYPVEMFYRIMRWAWIDSHMGFDTEILVRMIWKKVPVVYLPVAVSYPVGGCSNFRMFRDNVHISFMFARLTIGMFFRLPMLIHRKNLRRKNEGKSE